MLRPERNVDVETDPVHRDLDSPGHGILLADSIEHDVDRGLVSNDGTKLINLS